MPKSRLLTLQISVLTKFAKIKFSRKFPNKFKSENKTF